MSLVQINVAAITNLPPSQIGNISLNLVYNESRVLTGNNFSIDTSPAYSDPEGDPPSILRIDTTPTTGKLSLDGIVVTPGQQITWIKIAEGTFVYTAHALTTTAHTDFIEFSVADSGSLTFTSGGTMTFNMEAFANLPPTIGDNTTLTTTYGTPLIITEAMLTTDTTPPYSDPEGDLPLAARVTVLPTNGVLRLGGVLVSRNQIINWADIQANELVFYPDNTNFTNYTSDFNIQIADAGSGQFVD